MRYGVVACPKCGAVRGVEQDSKTMQCASCGKRTRLKGLKVLAETDDPLGLPRLVGMASAERKGGLQAYLDDVESERAAEKGDPLREALAKTAGVKDKAERFRAVFLILAGPSGTLEEEEVVEIIVGIKQRDVEAFLKHLIGQGIVFQPRPGTYGLT